MLENIVSEQRGSNFRLFRAEEKVPLSKGFNSVKSFSTKTCVGRVLLKFNAEIDRFCIKKGIKGYREKAGKRTYGNSN